MIARTLAWAYLGLFLAIGEVPGQSISFLRRLDNAQPSEWAAGIASDSTGVYVVSSVYPGSSPLTPFLFSKDTFVRKHTSTGSAVWVRSFGAPVAATAVAAAPGGGVYVVGVTTFNALAPVALPGQRASGLADVFVRRYDADGNELWTRQFGDKGPNDAYGVAVAEAGLYITGLFRPLSGPSQRPFLRKYDSNGTELWTREPAFLARAIAVDTGGIYMAGLMPPPIGGQLLYAFSKYGLDGSEIWTRRNTTSNYWTSAVIVDTTGVYTSGGNGLRKYDFDGNELWTAPATSPSALAIDEHGVYVTGTTNIRLQGQCQAGAQDQSVQHFDRAGHQLWTRQFGAYGDDFAAGIVVDSGVVYVAGTQNGYVAGVPILARLQTDSVTPTDSTPQIKSECVLNAASFVGGAVAPGEIVTILGSGIGPAAAASADLSSGRVPAILSDTRVLFNGMAAPLLYASGAQTTAVAPQGIRDSAAVSVQVEYKGVPSKAVVLPVLPMRPGIFTLDASGGGQAVVTNSDGSLNSTANPAEHGSVVSIYATGGGLVAPSVTDGQVRGDPPPKLLASVVRLLYSRDVDGDGLLLEYEISVAEVVSAAEVAGSVGGLVQIVAQVPDYLSAGTYSLQLWIGEDPSAAPDALTSPATATIAVR
jgi:uncharacterized protein (TIGR03437 family)